MEITAIIIIPIVVIVIVISVIINRHPDGDHVCFRGALEVLVLVVDEISSVEDLDRLTIIERVTVRETIKQINCMLKSAAVIIIKVQVCERQFEARALRSIEDAEPFNRVSLSLEVWIVCRGDLPCLLRILNPPP